MARQKVTQVQLSGQIGMSQPSLSARLRGLVPFNTTELLAVAQILGVRACDLLGDDKPVVAS